MASLSDPSKFAVSVAVGYAHILHTVLDFLDRAAATRIPVVVGLLTVPVLTAYLLLVTLVFAVRVAYGGDGTLAQAEALSPAAVLEWFANMVVKLAVSLVLFGALAFALVYFTSLSCSPGVTEL